MDISMTSVKLWPAWFQPRGRCSAGVPTSTRTPRLASHLRSLGAAAGWIGGLGCGSGRAAQAVAAAPAEAEVGEDEHQEQEREDVEEHVGEVGQIQHLSPNWILTPTRRPLGELSPNAKSENPSARGLCQQAKHAWVKLGLRMCSATAPRPPAQWLTLVTCHPRRAWGGLLH